LLQILQETCLPNDDKSYRSVGPLEKTSVSVNNVAWATHGPDLDSAP